MLVGGVIDDQVQHDPDASLSGPQGQLGEITEGTQTRVHSVEVGDVVAAVPQR